MNSEAFLRLQNDGEHDDFFNVSMLQKVFALLNAKKTYADAIAEAVFKKAMSSSQTELDDTESLIPIRLVSRKTLWMIISSKMKQQMLHLDETDFWNAWDVHFRHRNIIILIGGTSGCGKSTLASLLGSRLGFQTVISTDNIRSLMRSFVPAEDSPHLHNSTYATPSAPPSGARPSCPPAVAGWVAQAETVQPMIETFLEGLTSRGESAVVEGVHLSPDFMVKMSARLRCVPLVLYIRNEKKQRHRMAVRSKYMSEDPKHNRYIRHFAAIRQIQDRFVGLADYHYVPRRDNANMDVTLATMHSVLLICLRELSAAPTADPLMVLKEAGGEGRPTMRRLQAIFSGVLDAVDRADPPGG